MSIPTLLFFKDGKVQDQIIGMQDKQNITDKIDELLK
jgi:thioredoxin-like negative regulator of GroEL